MLPEDSTRRGPWRAWHGSNAPQGGSLARMGIAPTRMGPALEATGAHGDWTEGSVAPESLQWKRVARA